MYNVSELIIKMGAPRKYITAVKKAGAPFPLGRTRPKWVKKWLKAHAFDEALQRPIEP